MQWKSFKFLKKKKKKAGIIVDAVLNVMHCKNPSTKVILTESKTQAMGQLHRGL